LVVDRDAITECVDSVLPVGCAHVGAPKGKPGIGVESVDR
jgi:hypothetical protein